MLSRLALNAAVRQTAIKTLAVRGSASDVCSTGGGQSVANRPKRQEPGKVRLGFLPEEWFTFFHPKTGVTGPYVFGVGFATYLMSKEIYVMEHEFYNGLSILIMLVYAIKKFGPAVGAYLDKEVDAVEKGWKTGRENSLKQLQSAIEEEKKAQWRAQGHELLIAAKKENILMQLEAHYRERLMHAYREVKKRLDYQKEKSDVERRLQQKHMVDWIVTSVRKSISADQEKQALDRCISDLAALATRVGAKA